MKCAPLILRFMVIKESPLALCAVPPFTRGTKRYNITSLIKGRWQSIGFDEGIRNKTNLGG